MDSIYMDSIYMDSIYNHSVPFRFVPFGYGIRHCAVKYLSERQETMCKLYLARRGWLKEINKSVEEPVKQNQL